MAVEKDLLFLGFMNKSDTLTKEVIKRKDIRANVVKALERGYIAKCTPSQYNEVRYRITDKGIVFNSTNRE